MEAHEAAMAAHLAQQVMAAAMGERATQVEAIAAGHVAMEAATGAGSSACWTQQPRSMYKVYVQRRHSLKAIARVEAEAKRL